MVEPIATVDAVPLDENCANSGWKVPPAFTVIVPVIGQYAAVTVERLQTVVLSAAILVCVAVVLLSNIKALPIMAVAVPPFRSTLDSAAAG